MLFLLVFAYAGCDQAWLATLICVNLQTSFLTPPFGWALFFRRSVDAKETSTRAIDRGALPVVACKLASEHPTPPPFAVTAARTASIARALACPCSPFADTLRSACAAENRPTVLLTRRVTRASLEQANQALSPPVATARWRAGLSQA